MPTPHRVCPVSELPEGSRKIVELGGKSIGVFHVNGGFHAVRNVCPHQMAELCKGALRGTTKPTPAGETPRWDDDRDGYVICCPLHGWEFDIRDGKSVFNPHRVRVKAYPVSVEGGGAAPSDAAAASQDVDPGVETFDVEVDADAWVVVHA